MYGFVLGFVTALSLVVAVFAFGGAKARPLLQKQLEDLREERKSARARALAAAKCTDKFRLSTSDTVKLTATPVHMSTANAPCRVTMVGSIITIATAHNFHGTVPSTGAGGSKKKSESEGAKDDEGPTTQGGGEDGPTKKVSRPQDRVLCTLNAKQLVCQLDPKDRCSILLGPHVAGGTLAEVEDWKPAPPKAPPTDPAAKKKEKEEESPEQPPSAVPFTARWRALRITFSGGPREADRWLTVLNPEPATARWQRFVASVPAESESSLNFLVARILFQNSATNTLDDFIAGKIRKKVAKVSLPKPLAGRLTLADLSFGDEAPFFTNSQFAGTAPSGEFGFNFDLLYRGGFKLTLAAAVELGFVTIPSALITVHIRQLKARAHLSVGAPPSDKMWLGFHDLPELALEIHQELKLPPELGILAAGIRKIDLSDVISDIVRVKLFEDMVLPFMDDLPIPDVGPTPPSSPATVGKPVVSAMNATVPGFEAESSSTSTAVPPPAAAAASATAGKKRDPAATTAAAEGTRTAVHATPGTDAKKAAQELERHRQVGGPAASPPPTPSGTQRRTESASDGGGADSADEGGRGDAGSGVKRVAGEVRNKLEHLLHRRREGSDAHSRTPGGGSRASTPAPQQPQSQEASANSGSDAGGTGAEGEWVTDMDGTGSVPAPPAAATGDSTPHRAPPPPPKEQAPQHPPPPPPLEDAKKKEASRSGSQSLNATVNASNQPPAAAVDARSTSQSSTAGPQADGGYVRPSRVQQSQPQWS